MCVCVVAVVVVVVVVGMVVVAVVEQSARVSLCSGVPFSYRGAPPEGRLP